MVESVERATDAMTVRQQIRRGALAGPTAASRPAISRAMS